MPERMVERVARALCRHDGLPENTKHDGKPMWMDFISEARAALAAMRDLTEDMIAVATPAEANALQSVWHPMIDAALTEE